MYIAFNINSGRTGLQSDARTTNIVHMKGKKERELLGIGKMAAKQVTNGFILTAHFVEDSFDLAPADYLCHWNSIFSQRKDEGKIA